MADREKVIRGLQQHCYGSMFDRCGECPYYEFENEPFQCRDTLLLDTFTLLKEQEAKAGTWQWTIHGKASSGGTLGEAICDQCGKSTYATAVKGDLNYCPNCGAKMEGR